MIFSIVLPLRSEKTFFMGACLAFHAALFLERRQERDLELLELSVWCDVGDRRRRSARMTCEAKGSIMRDVRLGYNSCVMMPSKCVVIFVVMDNEIDGLRRWIL